MARRRFFVDEIRQGRAHIEGDDAHHLTRVLRVEPGQKYEISDNRNVYLAEIETARKNLVSFAILERLPTVEPTLRVTLYASLVRFERFELMLEKATELGVETIAPVVAERSEKGLDRAAEKRLPRWQRIVREASEQCRRAKLPELLAPQSLEEVLEPRGIRYLLDEDPAAAPILTAPTSGDEASILVGPEGGWTTRERELLLAKQWRAVSLGPAILKTETAAIAALAILNAAWQAVPS
jgi:16S rRNA (uracil1498-N3)-methyltransferase